jgi:hypothetical protein
LGGIPCGDGAFAGADDGDAAGGIDGGDGFVGGSEFGPAGDVAFGAVAEGGADREFHGLADAGLVFVGRDGEFGEFGVGGFGSGRALGDPVGEDSIIFGIDFDAFAAFVGDGGSGFEQEEAGAGIGKLDAAAAGFAGDGEMIGFGVVAEEGKFEAAFAGESAVAAAGVAAGFGEDGQDVVAEGNLRTG